MPDVIGIAVSMASGVNANYGTMTKPLHAGHAARNGMVAAHARQGRASPPTTRRWKAAAASSRRFARGMAWSAEPFDDLGRGTIWSKMGFRPKRYPCGGVIHTGIDAALQIRDELGPKVADITAIKAGISKYAASRAGAEYPANMEAAKFNLQYVVAASLANGVPKLATFEPDAIGDARVKALAGMVRSRSIRSSPTRTASDYPTRFAVTLKDGRTVERLVVDASGTAKNPMSPAQMREKFFDCAAHAGVERRWRREDRGDARPARRAAVARGVLAAAAARLSAPQAGLYRGLRRSARRRPFCACWSISGVMRRTATRRLSRSGPLRRDLQIVLAVALGDEVLRRHLELLGQRHRDRSRRGGPTATGCRRRAGGVGVALDHEHLARIALEHPVDASAMTPSRST